MTKSFCHFDTIPANLMDIIEADLSTNFDSQMQTSRLMGNAEVLDKRNSKNAWVPTTWWLGGLMWHYYKKANDEFFHYNIDQIDGESMQYTQYGLNERYDWHQDEGVSSLYKPQAGGRRNDQAVVQDFINGSAERIRKLSAIVQLANDDDYEGGATQIRDVDNTLYTIPRERGTIVFFDSRLQHRAKSVTKGLRKSLISWAVGPRWR
tara:strand:+ start:62 stop:682 length:621 start_codon:yes stop_codon:yes gene_type:complete